MMKSLFLTLAVASLVMIAEANDSASVAKFSNRSKTGGELVKRGSFTGCVAIIDEQSELDHTNVVMVAKLLAESTLCNVIATIDRHCSANFTIRIVSDDRTPVMLLAPEDKWAVVNVKHIADDVHSIQDRDALFASRSRKEIIKAFSLLCGGGSSQFPGNLMNTPDLKSLDSTPEQIPMDMVGYYQSYLNAHGVTPKEMTTYKVACREGWAPLPTNDEQKVIWDRVHEIPREPIKIKFTP